MPRYRVVANNMYFNQVTGTYEAGKILGDMAPTYFVSVAAIVAAFYAKEAIAKK